MKILVDKLPQMPEECPFAKSEHNGIGDEWYDCGFADVAYVCPVFTKISTNAQGIFFTDLKSYRKECDKMAECIEQERLFTDISKLTINRIPTADVSFERHGRWIEKRGYNIPLDVYEVGYNCSCCGNIAYKKYTFCPNCGAEMDGKDDE